VSVVRDAGADAQGGLAHLALRAPQRKRWAKTRPAALRARGRPLPTLFRHWPGPRRQV